jgi:7,8-dihydro-6-hydroxymethylpterin-pyrophosphokinase
VAGATHLYAIAIGSNRPHGRHGRPTGVVEAAIARLGRRWGPRVLDLDVILWSGGRYRSRRLAIPHSQLAKRSFVLQPLAAIAPDWRVEGPLTAGHLAYRLAQRAPVTGPQSSIIRR